MAPGGAWAVMAAERAVTSAAASSRVRIPATVAAAISPWEWPATAAGSMPWWAHRAARAVITAHSTGWMTAGESRSGPPGAGLSGLAVRMACRFQPAWGARASAHSLILAAKAGEDARRSAVMPGHWLPWPGKTSTGRAPPAGALPVITAGCGCPAASAASPARTSGAGAGQDGPVLELGPRRGQRIPHLRRVGVRAVIQPPVQPGGGILHGLRGPPRQRPQDQAVTRAGVLVFPGGRGFGGLFEYEVGVGA